MSLTIYRYRSGWNPERQKISPPNAISARVTVSSSGDPAFGGGFPIRRGCLDDMLTLVQHDALGSFAHGGIGYLGACWDALLGQPFQDLRCPNDRYVGRFANPNICSCTSASLPKPHSMPDPPRAIITPQFGVSIAFKIMADRLSKPLGVSIFNTIPGIFLLSF